MVSRDTAARNAPKGLPAVAFQAWRRWLYRPLSFLTGLPGRFYRSTRSVSTLSLTFLAEPRSFPADAAPRGTLARAGGAALILGVTIGLVVAPGFGIPIGVSVLATAWALLWSLVRLLALLLASRMPQRTTRAVWAASLLPFAVGFTPLLRIVALAASARLAFGALQAAGETRRTAIVAVGWAFGGQLVAEILRWAATGALFALPLLGR